MHKFTQMTVVKKPATIAQLENFKILYLKSECSQKNAALNLQIEEKFLSMKFIAEYIIISAIYSHGYILVNKISIRPYR